jgi:hypothetical protein
MVNVLTAVDLSEARLDVSERRYHRTSTLVVPNRLHVPHSPITHGYFRPSVIHVHTDPIVPVLRTSRMVICVW